MASLEIAKFGTKNDIAKFCIEFGTWVESVLAIRGVKSAQG